MRILHLGTDSFGGHGGIALYNRDLIAAMASHPECDEVVAVPRLVPQPIETLPPKVTFVTEAGGGSLPYLRTLTRVLRGRRFDLVVCAHMNLLPFARMATPHPLLIAYGIEAWRPTRKASTRLLHSCRAIGAISEITRDRLRFWSGYNGPMPLLPNAIHAEQYGIRPRPTELARKLGIEGKRVLLTVGRLAAAERYKGFDEVLELLPFLPEDVVYLIAGGGDDIGRLKGRAEALGVSGRVVFTGRFEEQQKPDLYALADVYVMPSHGEGFGFVFLEALASGVPVIASKQDGGREAVRNGELGLLVDPSNPAEIRAAIIDLLDRRERRIPPGLEHFSFANFELRVHEIVSSILHGNA